MGGVDAILCLVTRNEKTAGKSLEVLTAVVTASSPLKVNRRFRGTYLLHLQDRIIRTKCQSESKLLGLIFNPENGSDMFLRNVRDLSP
jgi:hypothetical protein